jgi:hypothetical protein
MNDLPVCKLCGVVAVRLQEQFEDSEEPVRHPLATTYQSMCPLELIIMDEDQWRTLMAPPVVTDAMVERGADAMEAITWPEERVSWSDIRAVLEAALKE